MNLFKILFIAVFFYSNYANAWSCGKEDVYFKEYINTQYNYSDFVATIKPYHIEEFEGAEDGLYAHKLIHAQVLNSWKGSGIENIVLRDLESPISGYVQFLEASEYLIYADKPKNSDIYEVNVCSVTNLKYLDERHIPVLNKIKSNTISLEQYYEVVKRVKHLIDIDEIDIIQKDKSVEVTIDFYADSVDWRTESLIRFIKSEAKSLGIANVGNFIKKNNSESNQVIWTHPQN